MLANLDFIFAHGEMGVCDGTYGGFVMKEGERHIAKGSDRRDFGKVARIAKCYYNCNNTICN
jgi:hypothetical protein